MSACDADCRMGGVGVPCDYFAAISAMPNRSYSRDFPLQATRDGMGKGDLEKVVASTQVGERGLQKGGRRWVGRTQGCCPLG